MHCSQLNVNKSFSDQQCVLSIEVLTLNLCYLIKKHESYICCYNNFPNSKMIISDTDSRTKQIIAELQTVQCTVEKFCWAQICTCQTIVIMIFWPFEALCVRCTLHY